MTRDAIEAWLARYVSAWSSNRPEDVGALFAEDATYRVTPFAEPWHGREAIVAGWLDRRDEPGTFEFRHDVLAVEGDAAVVRGHTRYRALGTEFSNVWLVRLDAAGRCREFVEWWMERPRT